MADDNVTSAVGAPTFIDLFCGCGGFSLGLVRAGLRCLAAIDFNGEAVEVFRANFPEVPHALETDLTDYPPTSLSARLGIDRVDVIVGGPPCQGFSTVRQVDAANHGARVRRDKRRYLFRVFLDYVEYFQPRVFVMENVLGLQSAAKGKFFTMVQHEARNLGYRVHPQIEEAWKLGVPQKRRRQLIIGVRTDVPGFLSELEPASRAFAPSDRARKGPMLWDAIGDLPPLGAGDGEEACDYDSARRVEFLSGREACARHYLEEVLEIARAPKLTAHRSRPHSSRDLRDFARLREGESAAQAIVRGEKMEFPYDRDVFLDRYTRQHRERLCSTIVAHLAKDGLMFVHPTQNRSLTPREAARIQTFPDWFLFPVARTHQFRLIGNAVPPLVAEAVGEELQKFLGEKCSNAEVIPFELAPLPKDEVEAVKWLRPFLEDPSPRFMKAVAPEAFKQAWYAIAFLYAGLHPDAALDHGERISRKAPEDYALVRRLDPRLLAPYYERSGWPVVLAAVAREAWRRYRAGNLADDEFYCSEAQMAGMCHRNPQVAASIRRERATT
jgi:DNA (cytosine-5)-methyltransferase 1